MNQVLGHSAGNAVEMIEAIDILTGQQRDPRLLEVTLALGADMLVLGGLAASTEQARHRLMAALEQGQAAERFAEMVHALGGPAQLLQQPQRHLAAAPLRRPVLAAHSGFIASHATRHIGLVVIELGGGRRVASDNVDHRVGLTQILPPGTAVQQGDTLAWVHAADEDSAQRAVLQLQQHVAIGEQAPTPAPVLLEHIA